MKKLYSLALAAIAGSATVFAANPILKADLNNVEAVKAELNKSELTIAPTRTAVTASKANKVASRMAKAPNYDAMTWSYLGEGKYASSVVAATYGATNDPVDVEIYEAEGNEGVYKVVGVWPDMVMGGELIVDASDPNFVMVPNQETGIVDNVDGETYIASQTYIFTEEKGYDAELVKQALPELVPVLVDGVIEFPAQSLALQWPNAQLGGKYGTDPDEWYIGKLDGYLVLPGAEFVEPWTFFGTGVFTDYAVASLVSEEPIPPYEVEVYQGTKEPYLYKVLNPWKGAYAALGSKNESPEIILDASDPDNVLLELTSIGLSNQQYGEYSIFNYGYAIAPDAPEAGDPLTTLTEDKNTVTFTFEPRSLWLYLEKGLDENGKGGIAGWLNAEACTIVIAKETPGTSGVDEVAVDADAPVEYFNLQGVRIDNPAAGQVVIKRQGTAVSKEFVR